MPLDLEMRRDVYYHILDMRGLLMVLSCYHHTQIPDFEMIIIVLRVLLSVVFFSFHVVQYTCSGVLNV